MLVSHNLIIFLPTYFTEIKANEINMNTLVMLKQYNCHASQNIQFNYSYQLSNQTN